MGTCCFGQLNLCRLYFDFPCISTGQTCAFPSTLCAIFFHTVASRDAIFRPLYSNEPGSTAIALATELRPFILSISPYQE
jgi:hypothetical protein